MLSLLICLVQESRLICQANQIWVGRPNYGPSKMLVKLDANFGIGSTRLHHVKPLGSQVLRIFGFFIVRNIVVFHVYIWSKVGDEFCSQVL